MTYPFDTLGNAKRLRDAGVPSEQAEAHAEAAREFVMGELVTRFDLDTAVGVVRQEIVLSENRVQSAIDSVEQRHEAAITGMRQDLEAQRRETAMALERLTLQMTVRLGGMIAIAVAVLATIIKL